MPLAGLKSALLLLGLAFAPQLHAHEFKPARLTLDETAAGHYRVIWRYPAGGIGARPTVVFPAGCDSRAQQPYPQGDYWVEQMELACETSLKGQIIEIAKLGALTDALVTITHLGSDQSGDIVEAMLTPGEPQLVVPAEPQPYPATGYFSLGIDHLLSGLDHLLFIMGLMFVVVGIGNTVKAITAFTAAHSITLGLSLFEIVSLPQSTVEAVIALTIVYLALEISSRKQYHTTPWLIAFGFGLLHGLGFAGALREIGIADGQLLLSLLFFNLGIEAGQLMMIPVFALLLWLARQWNRRQTAGVLASWLLGAMGCYWLIDRVAGIVGA